LTSGGNNFNDFLENQLPKFQQIGMAAAILGIPLPAPRLGVKFDVNSGVIYFQVNY